MSPSRRTAARLAFVPVLVAALAIGPSTAGAATRLHVTAFQLAGDRLSLIDRSARAIDVVGVDGVLIAENGASVGRPGKDAARQLRRAHKRHLRAELLVSNYSDRLNDFSEPVAHQLLSSAKHRRDVVRSLVADVKRRKWDGIGVDLEALTRRDNSGLTKFVRALAKALPRRASLSIAVSNSTTRAGYRAGGYDLRALAKRVDRVTLMVYDQHGPWEDAPGPIGSLGWQRAGIKAALHDVPRRKLELGVAGYGYAWRPHSNDTLSDARARALAGKRARFDAKAGEWTARLADGSTLWWSDARSWQLRVNLARSQHLHGLALWSLGQSDRLR